MCEAASATHWDYTWHWYDGSGRRLMSELVPYHEGRDALDPKTVTGGRRDYYIYDGDELTLTLRHGSDGGWRVAQRVLSAGIDGALAGRYWTPDAGSPQSLFVLRDRQGTTLGAYRADGTPDPLSWYQPLGAFGAPAGDGSSTSGGKGSATATGFTGAGAPSASGGYVYLRNRWYDPQTGRFLTQDPIGLSGGVNLYAYAGNDPVNFSDPFGLCTKADHYKNCPSDWWGSQARNSSSLKGKIGNRMMQALAIVGEAVGEAATTAGKALIGACDAGDVECTAMSIMAAFSGDGGVSDGVAPDFVVTPAGEAIPVPDGATGPAPTRSSGMQLTGGSGGKGMDSRVTGVRIMDANGRQPRRVNYMNAQGQTVNPATGKTISNADRAGHIELKP